VEGFKLRYLAETLTVMGKPHLGEAENFLLRAIEVDGQRKIVWSLAMDYGAMSALLAKRGDFEKALDCCAKAVGLFHECGSSGWAEKYGKEIQALAAISKERGRNEK
jgi:tetratricopeptide (TPR) repeat protein